MVEEKDFRRRELSRRYIVNILLDGIIESLRRST